MNYEQLSIYDNLDKVWEENKPEQMSSEAWKVYRYFRDSALRGYQIKRSAKELSEILGLTDRTLREASEEISRFTDMAFIGDNNGYYIGSKAEFDNYIEMRKQRTKSSLVKTCHAMGGVDYFFRILNEIKDEVHSHGASRQQRMPLTKGTIEEVRKYFEDYKENV